MADLPDTQWIRIKGIVAEAIDRAPDSRAAWIESRCAGDAALKGEVEALVRAHERAGAFLEASALVSPGAAERVVATIDAPDAAPSMPERFGAYRVLRELGRGGMGVVYLGSRDDDRFEKQVAIKVVSGNVVHPAVFRRFEDERRILASLDHPNIARLLDARNHPGRPALRGHGARRGRDDRRVLLVTAAGEPPSACDCSASVCAAVQYSHQHLVVHRDIKARNILVAAGRRSEAARLRHRQAAGAGS